MKPTRISKQKTRNSGFTLMELIIALAIIMIAGSGIFLAFRTSDRRALQNASLQLQADLRYVQRRARIEGRNFDIMFEPALNRYRVRSHNPPRLVRYVYFENGVNISRVYSQNTGYTPRGTPFGAQTIRLYIAGRRHFQVTTIVPAGGRVRIWDIDTMPH